MGRTRTSQNYRAFVCFRYLVVGRYLLTMLTSASSRQASGAGGPNPCPPSMGDLRLRPQSAVSGGEDFVKGLLQFYIQVLAFLVTKDTCV